MVSPLDVDVERDLVDLGGHPTGQHRIQAISDGAVVMDRDDEGVTMQPV